MSYLKIKNDIIIQAPEIFQKNGYTIIGYNTKTNQEMLFSDGYAYFEYPKEYYIIKDNKIIINPDHQHIDPDPIIQSNVFTKRQIRLALRKLNKESLLNEILASDQLIQLDWTEAQDIDLELDQTKNILNKFHITNEQIKLLKETIRSL